MLTPDPFLTGILGRQALRLAYSEQLAKALADPDSKVVRELEAAFEESFLDVKVPVSDLRCVAALQHCGFRLIDTNLQLERGCEPWPQGSGAFEHPTIGFAASADREGVARTAEASFRHSRFHLDPEIPSATADRIKARWAANFFSGERGDAMVVARTDEAIAGFLQLLQGDGLLVIDLIAVEAEQRGRGLAGAMIRFAAEHCNGFEKLVVGTQVANTASIRLYEALGFRCRGASYVLHRHHASAANAPSARSVVDPAPGLREG